MQLKKAHRYIIFFFALLPITAYAQTSIYKLPKGRTGLGLGFRTTENINTITGSLDYGIDKDLRISFAGGVALIEDDEFNTSLEIPPAPAVGLSIVRINPLGQTGLDYFVNGDFSAMFSRTVDAVTNETFVKTRTLGLTGGGGLLKRLGTKSGWGITPFFGVYYSNAWVVTERQWIGWIGFEETVSDSNILGEAGIEIQMSKTTSIIGSLLFSFESSDTTFSIGINLY
ncbi:hypothetical protein C6503_00810 [Candidatus Poribacteria bacterium]|nr:MAG: hypothetical protein C6503_00810 [Candidatus Poribacteria bacterium]